MCVEGFGKICRRRLVDGESIGAIARDLRRSRNTVKRARRSESGVFEYQRKRQPRPRLGPYIDTLEALLEAEERLAARERRTAQRLYEALCVESYTGAFDAARRQQREFEQRRHPVSIVFILQCFAPGEAFQFDFRREDVELGSVDELVTVAQVRLSYIRAFFLVAYPRESQEMVFDAHAKAFEFFGDAPRRGIYNNLRPALYSLECVKEACAAAVDKQVVSSTRFLNLLHRAAAPSIPVTLQVPESLKLTLEQATNCDRYDQLLRPRRAANVVPFNPLPDAAGP